MTERSRGLLERALQAALSWINDREEAMKSEIGLATQSREPQSELHASIFSDIIVARRARAGCGGACHASSGGGRGQRSRAHAGSCPHRGRHPASPVCGDVQRAGKTRSAWSSVHFAPPSSPARLKITSRARRDVMVGVMLQIMIQPASSGPCMPHKALCDA